MIWTFDAQSLTIVSNDILMYTLYADLMYHYLCIVAKENIISWQISPILIKGQHLGEEKLWKPWMNLFKV